MAECQLAPGAAGGSRVGSQNQTGTGTYDMQYFVLYILTVYYRCTLIIYM